MNRFMMLCLLAIQPPLFARTANNPDFCGAPEQIQAEIDRANPDTIENLVEKYPGDFWIRRVYIDSMLKERTPPPRLGGGIPGGKVQESVIERFRMEYEGDPENPESAYLYAYSLIHSDTDKSIKILTEITRKTPAFSPAYLTLSILHGYTNFQDQGKQRALTEAYLARCPDTLDSRVASNALLLDKSDILVAYIQSLRKHIPEKADAPAISLYPTLWRLEEKIARPGEQAELKKRIEGDLQFIEGLDDTVAVIKGFILAQGYERIGDTAALEKLGNRNPLYSLSKSNSYSKARMEWTRSNLPPAPGADPETRVSYYRKQVEFLDQWMDQLPDNSSLLSDRFKALASIPDTPDDRLIQEGERIFTVIRRSSGGLINPAMEVLQTWAQRDIQTERIPSLIHEFMKMPAQPAFLAAKGPDSDLGNSNPLALMAESNRWPADVIGWSTLLTLHCQKHEFDLAREVLEEWGKGIEERQKKADEIASRKKPADTGGSPSTPNVARNTDINEMLENSIVSGISRDKATYYEACARLATVEQRSLDALTFYQTSLRLMYGRSIPPDITVLAAGKAADSLWKELGGSEAGWKAWLDSIRSTPAAAGSRIAPGWNASNRVIPDFSLSDQSGKTWTLASLKGKTTLINVWATWCGPCRLEHPHLQKLYERIKDRNDIQVITLNVDEDRSLVDPYLGKNNLSFPSLYANPFVKEFAGPIGIPTSWISDSTGTIRSEMVGFRSDDSQWLERTLQQIESVGGGGK